MPWGAAIAAGAALVGGAMTNKANSDAADKSAAASIESARLANEGIDKQIAAIREGNAQAQETLNGIRTDAAPGTTYLRQIVGQTEGLTEAQQRQLDEQRRLAPGYIQRSGFAGSGRTAASILRKVEGDTVSQFLDQNRQRRDTAATNMANGAYGAATNVAVQQAGLGDKVGQAYGNQGANTGGAVKSAGEAQAQAGVANAQVTGQTIGDIASIVNTERKSRYNDTPKASTSNIDTSNFDRA